MPRRYATAAATWRMWLGCAKANLLKKCFWKGKAFTNDSVPCRGIPHHEELGQRYRRAAWGKVGGISFQQKFGKRNILRHLMDISRPGLYAKIIDLWCHPFNVALLCNGKTYSGNVTKPVRPILLAGNSLSQRSAACQLPIFIHYSYSTLILKPLPLKQCMCMRKSFGTPHSTNIL